MTENSFINDLSKLGINLTKKQLEQFQRYYELLIEWNEKINLTAITEKEAVYLKHFYDSATIVKSINLNEINSLCDIGTGAGFPGLVLKILFPELNIVLIDALEKRIKFLNIVIEELNLEKIETIHARSEEYGKNNREIFDVVTARAVAPLPILIEYCVPLVKENGYFIPLKANISQEILESENAINLLNLKIKEKIEFDLPYEAGHRTIIKFIKTKKTLLKYPRKNSEIKKRPL